MCKGGKTIKTSEEKLMKKILSAPLNDEEKEQLIKSGFNFKKPTKNTLIFVALYKKAAGGDMTAIREIRNITEGNNTDSTGVTIIDNVGN